MKGGFIMGSFSTTEKGVRIMHIWAPNNARLALEILDRHLRYGMICPKEYNRAVLLDNGPNNGNSEDPNNYTLKFESADRTEELWVSGVFVGPRSPESHGALQCLMLMGFDPDPERDIFQAQKGVRKVFSKKKYK